MELLLICQRKIPSTWSEHLWNLISPVSQWPGHELSAPTQSPNSKCRTSAWSSGKSSCMLRPVESLGGYQGPEYKLPVMSSFKELAELPACRIRLLVGLRHLFSSLGLEEPHCSGRICAPYVPSGDLSMPRCLAGVPYLLSQTAWLARFRCSFEKGLTLLTGHQMTYYTSRLAYLDTDV